MVYTILVIVQVVVALSLIALILLQHGKGADAGAAFGSGASGTVFGAKGTANFMSRATAALATVFMLSSLTLAYLVNGGGVGSGSGSVTDQLNQQGTPTPSSVIDDQSQPNSNPNTGGSSNSNGASSQPNSDNGGSGPKIPE